METLSRAITLVPDDYGLPTAWLGRWCHVRGHFDFASADRTADESLRDAATRAVVEGLPLTKRDVLVANMAQLNLEYVDQQPDTETPLAVQVAFYMVHLYRAPARAAVDNDDDCRWLTAEELLSGDVGGGYRVSPLLTRLLRQADLFRA